MKKETMNEVLRVMNRIDGGGYGFKEQYIDGVVEDCIELEVEDLIEILQDDVTNWEGDCYSAAKNKYLTDVIFELKHLC